MIGPVDGSSASSPQPSALGGLDGNAFLKLNYRRCRNNPRNFLLSRGHVIDRERVRGSIGDSLRSPLVLGINKVGPDRLDLVQDVLLARHSDRHHQN